MLIAKPGAEVELYHNASAKLATTSTGINVTGSINTVLSVDGTTEDVFITGATPGLEFVENDSGGSRMRMAWNTSGSFSPTLYQSLYGDSTTTYGGINIQTRASDGSGNQVVYAYDPANDRNWWGTRAAGDVAMQLQSDGTFNVRGGDVVFENSAATSDDFYWKASTSRLGLGTTNPSYIFHVNAGTDNGVALFESTDPTASIFLKDSTTSTAFNVGIKATGDDLTLLAGSFGSDPVIIKSTGNVGIGASVPSSLLHLKSNAPYITFEDDDNNQDWQIQATAWRLWQNASWQDWHSIHHAGRSVRNL
jgi:hypothetical protein